MLVCWLIAEYDYFIYLLSYRNVFRLLLIRIVDLKLVIMIGIIFKISILHIQGGTWYEYCEKVFHNASRK